MPVQTAPHPTSSIQRRTLLRAAVAGCGAALVGCGTPAPTPAPGGGRLRLLGEAMLAHKLPFEGTTVGGVSGLDFDPAGGLWVALSDDRSELQPARFYTLRLEPAAGRTLYAQLLSVVTLRQAAGTPFPPRRAGGEVVDPEAIRWLPGGNVLWSSEGDERVLQPPGLRESRGDGSLVRAFDMPEILRPSRPGTGPRDNLSFEGLALTPDVRSAWLAMEGPLQQDGPLAGVNREGGPCRFTHFDLATGRATRQIAYQPDAIPIRPTVPGGFADNGVSEVLMLDAHRMLVLERAYAMGSGNSLRLYEIDTRQADDVLAEPRLRPGQYRAPDKTLVADFAASGLARLDNTEAMCWGPALANGQRTLYVASDDNFSGSQVTQLAAFAFSE
jgi:hypothetical protein